MNDEYTPLISENMELIEKIAKELREQDRENNRHKLNRILSCGLSKLECCSEKNVVTCLFTVVILILSIAALLFISVIFKSIIHYIRYRNIPYECRLKESDNITTFKRNTFINKTVDEYSLYKCIRFCYRRIELNDIYINMCALNGTLISNDPIYSGLKGFYTLSVIFGIFLTIMGFPSLMFLIIIPRCEKCEENRKKQYILKASKDPTVLKKLI